MASLTTVVALLAVLVASCTGAAVKDLSPRISNKKNIDECYHPELTHMKLLETNIYEPAKFLVPVKRTITFPETGLNTHPITCLKVINMDPTNHGGYPDILNGGVGSTDVQIRLVSQWGQPLNFRIEIWSDDYY